MNISELSGLEQIWPCLIRQQYVDAVGALLLLTFSGIALVYLCLYTKKHWNEGKREAGDSIYHEFFYLFPIGILLVTFLVSFILACHEVPDMFNPEFGAMQDLLSRIRPHSK